MKRVIHILLSFLLIASLSSSFFAFSEESPSDPLQHLKDTHEEFILQAIQLLSKYAMDDTSLYNTDKVIERPSKAWYMLEKFDKGWFTNHRKPEFTNLRTDNWQKISETEFCVEAHCDLTVHYSYNSVVEVFPVSYHFCVRQTNAAKNLWRIYDFHVIANEQDLANAARYTENNEGIALEVVTGMSFSGYLMTIDDPSRVFVGTIDKFGNNNSGFRINAFLEKYDALAGINGGAFNDPKGSGTGGQPVGIVCTEGTMLRNHTPGNGASKILIGFDADNKLVVGNYPNKKDVEALNLRDALAFNRVLIQDGKIAEEDFRGNYSTRTAIGQDADGRVMFLICKGRQPNSFGACFNDLANILYEHGCVTAANLDGGTSTCLYLAGESVYSGYKLDCSRRIPTAFLVKKLPENQ